MLTRRTALVMLAATATVPVPALAQRANPMPPALRTALERNPALPVLGNPDGDITLSEFFDYNCPHCRKLVPTIQRLIAADPKLRVAFREWPVFGQGSVFATRASLASLQQGKYWPLHKALMAMRERAAEASVLRIAGQVGLDLARLKKDMESEAVLGQIAQTAELADHIGLIGTPTLIAGDEAVFGDSSLAEIQALIARGRKTLAS